ncbi:uncharacterized protein LOC115756712 [Rhodamnia argentea]|uniref:Uncharacterized protein LOC115756712 n=1 Tax=Rhodamnia argentea TaxID=178133 RepID=A0A8B8QYZ6_9MYRT|nr:uncharacterized protein LOC115756712 [Rhodamnia argentea]
MSSTHASIANVKTTPPPDKKMLSLLHAKLRRLCHRLRWPLRLRHRRSSDSKVVVQQFGKSLSNHDVAGPQPPATNGSSSTVHPNNHPNDSKLPPPLSPKSIRIATFNAALFSMAPAVPNPEKSSSLDFDSEGVVVNLRAKSAHLDRPRGILKQSPLHPINGQDHLTKQQKFARSKLRVSINLPDNEISLLRSRRNLSFTESSAAAEPPLPSSSPHSSSSASASASIGRIFKGKAPATARWSFENGGGGDSHNGRQAYRSTRTVVEVLRELDADIVALQDVKAEEEREMKPLSELAAALGMSYAFAESWAPEYGNAVLSRWPIKQWKVQKIFDDTDFRNVLKATIEVPQVGEVNFQCTHLDHLDEDWRMKQIGAIIHSSDSPHILAGGLNSLDETDYSQERWTDIVKYYEEMGKPTPKVEVMRFLKNKQYTDAKDFAGECESVVVIAKGQSVQGTCKYGTRVDYILASPDCPYEFVPGSYSVLSSKGTSDHHIVKVDVTKCAINTPCESNSNDSKVAKKTRRQRKHHQAVVKITGTAPPSKGIWKTNTLSKVQ